ncbi:hypothetical protein [Pelosinus sp. IPA-1]|uniref:hypothetical protein n=1 Tax=Pelosinus sp. IPA-1 TaxID=3029569 RepID=UPI0024361F6D|nr:hypothetical protein [Pelosinus sp. IPA-1]GMA99733.1 hypothetical protein PIPA1_25330 [Pelosinus sp. IPA-1]
MAINSVDLQVLIPKATEVGKAQSIAKQQDTLQQQQFAEQWKDISTNRQQQVQGTAKSEGGKIGREKEPREKNHPRDEKNCKGTKKNDKECETLNHASNEDPILGHLVDIKT